MFERPHHKHIHELLQALNADFLARTECFFGGGTAIVLLLDEYRESISQSLSLAREVKADRYGIRTFVEINGVPIKFEIVPGHHRLGDDDQRLGRHSGRSLGESARCPMVKLQIRRITRRSRW